MQRTFKTIFLFLLILIANCGDKNLNVSRSLRKDIPIDFNANHFFIAPHPDDWQLFMGEYAYDTIRSSSTKVTIVTTNAGDEGLGTAYWEARELADIASVRAALGYSLTNGDPSEVDETLTLNGKNIRHHTLRNVSMYFFRLPDGFPDGSGTSDSKGQSMLKLMRNEINSLTSIDQANTFTWNDLQNVLKSIVDKEFTGTNAMVFHIQDPGSEKKYSHSDHLVTQQLAREVSSQYADKNCKQIAFEDYRTKNKTENLSKSQFAKKALLLEAYDVIMMDKVQKCGICLRDHFEWLKRSYRREFNC